MTSQKAGAGKISRKVKKTATIIKKQISQEIGPDDEFEHPVSKGGKKPNL
jgi:hypothetical protein